MMIMYLIVKCCVIGSYTFCRINLFNTLKSLDKIMGFSVHLHLFYNL